MNTLSTDTNFDSIRVEIVFRGTVAIVEVHYSLVQRQDTRLIVVSNSPAFLCWTDAYTFKHSCLALARANRLMCRTVIQTNLLMHAPSICMIPNIIYPSIQCNPSRAARACHILSAVPGPVHSTRISNVLALMAAQPLCLQCTDGVVLAMMYLRSGQLLSGYDAGLQGPYTHRICPACWEEDISSARAITDVEHQC
jgi:hypothetical protein